MKICLINPPNFFSKPIGYEWYPNIFTLPYLGLGYITSSIKKSGYDVTHIDCPLQNLDEKYIFQFVEENQFDIIGLSCFYYNLLSVTKIVRYINAHCKNTFIFLGGFMPTLDYSTLFSMRMKFDCCIVGAGEYTAVELIKKLEMHEDWTKIEGISYIENGFVKNNKRTTCIHDLDALPFPYRCTSPYQTKHVSVLSSRGCYGDCTFCGEKEYALENASPYIRYRSVNNLIEEISLLWNEYKFRKLRFNDSNFMDGSQFRKKWLKEFAEKVEGLPYKFLYSCNARANDIIAHEEILPLLYKSGLEAVFLGIESFNQRQLDLYSKRTTVFQNISALEILKRNGIKVEIGLIFIEPFVTVEEFEENLVCLENSAFFDIVDITQSFISSACTLISIPGTRMHDIINRHGVATKKNNLGYFFVDKRMNIIHDTLVEWENETRPYADKRYLIYKAKETGQAQLAEKLSCWYKKMIKADFLFLKKLSKIIRERQDLEEAKREIIEDTKNQFKKISDEVGLFSIDQNITM